MQWRLDGREHQTLLDQCDPSEPDGFGGSRSAAEEETLLVLSVVC
jgi:hypothetical protein